MSDEVKVPLNNGAGDSSAGQQGVPQMNNPDAKNICGFQFSFVEAFFILSLPVGLGCIIFTSLREMALVTKFISFLPLIAAVIGCIYVWNYETTKKLAKTATAMQQMLEQKAADIKKMEEQNQQLIRSNAELKEKLDRFKSAVSILGGSVKNMDAVEKKLSEILRASGDSNERRHKLFEDMMAFSEKQDHDVMDRQRQLFLQKVRDQCHDADEDRDGHISAGKEMDRIRKYIVKAHMEFKFSEGPAKKVAVFEIMDALEKYAETHYAQIKEALKEKRQLSRQIEQVRRDIHKVKPAKSKFRKVAGALKSKFGGKKGADR